MTKKLNINNPEHLIYESEQLKTSILGGIRFNHLDRLQVTLRMEVKDRKFEHYLNHPELANMAYHNKLDLYNDVQLEKHIRKAAEKLEIGSIEIAKHLGNLIYALESYRLEERQAIEKPQEDVRLSEEERATAIKFAKQKNLMEKINQLIGEYGVMGEEMNRLLLFTVFFNAKQSHTLHVISLGSSGMGKSHLQNTIAELIPDYYIINSTSITENALYYFGKQEVKNRIILFEDIDGAKNSFYAVREFQSRNKISKTMVQKDRYGESKTVQITAIGPVTIAGCTTAESLYEDNANRCFLIEVDESKEQTERIIQQHKKKAAGKIDEGKRLEIKHMMHAFFRVLEPVKIVNPYAELLELPQELLKPRRTVKHYLNCIEAITYLHQYQREQKADEQTGEIYIESTVEDIEWANRLLKEVLLKKSDELSGKCRAYFETVKELLKSKKVGGLDGSTFTNREISLLLRKSISTVKSYNKDLYDWGYLEREQDTESKKFYYQLANFNDYGDLQSKINNTLAANVLNAKGLSGHKQPKTKTSHSNKRKSAV